MVSTRFLSLKLICHCDILKLINTLSQRKQLDILLCIHSISLQRSLIYSSLCIHLVIYTISILITIRKCSVKNYPPLLHRQSLHGVGESLNMLIAETDSTIFRSLIFLAVHFRYSFYKCINEHLFAQSRGKVKSLTIQISMRVLLMAEMLQWMCLYPRDPGKNL